jgi:hypothetical protein
VHSIRVLDFEAAGVSAFGAQITTGLYEWYYTIGLNQEPKEPAGYSQEDDDFQPDPRNCSELWYMDGLR